MSRCRNVMLKIPSFVGPIESGRKQLSGKIGLLNLQAWSRFPLWQRSSLCKVFSTSALESESTASGALDPSAPVVLDGDDGRKYAMIDLRRTPKLKPHIVKRRLSRMRTYTGAEKDIRHSPWRLNLICQMVSGLTLPEALTQLQFSTKSKAPLVQKVLTRTANLADIRDGLQPSQLEVAECFATQGSHLKRIKPMGRGRSGKMTHKKSHMRVVLREIDFKLRIYQAASINQKKVWLRRQVTAKEDGERAMSERREAARMEAQQEELKRKQLEGDAKKS